MKGNSLHSTLKDQASYNLQFLEQSQCEGSGWQPKDQFSCIDFSSISAGKLEPGFLPPSPVPKILTNFFLYTHLLLQFLPSIS